MLILEHFLFFGLNHVEIQTLNKPEKLSAFKREPRASILRTYKKLSYAKLLYNPRKHFDNNVPKMRIATSYIQMPVLNF